MEHIESILKDILAELKAMREQGQQGPRPFLTVDEVANMLGLSSKTIRNKMSRNSFQPRPLRIGGRLMFRAVDFERLGECSQSTK